MITIYRSFLASLWYWDNDEGKEFTYMYFDGLDNWWDETLFECNIDIAAFIQDILKIY